MKKTTLLSLAILLLLACGAALALPAQPATAPTAPAASISAPFLASLPGGAHYTAVMKCEPPTRFVCVNRECQCAEITCAATGVKSFTCNATTGVSSCVCN